MRVRPARGAWVLFPQSLLRLLLAAAAILAAAALAGCNDKTPDISGRHMQPLSEETLADLDSRNMARESPILIRIFKEESVLELWKADRSGRFALLRTYPICRWSGDLGPKMQEGDRQAPEGFYNITSNLMNPRSNYHLAINIGFPNAYDRANGRSGSFVMIHGDCASVGCYAVTDEQITEVYSLAREAFFAGHRSFQVQVYPFRMTPFNMARHRDSPHLAFWKMLKQGHDHFEVTRKEPRVAVCDMHYVFDAQSPGKFDPVNRCPAYKVPKQIASAVQDKQELDEIETIELISRGVPAVLPKNGEGGMNFTFVSALRSNGGPGTPIRTASGTIPAHVRPPADWLPRQETRVSVFTIPSPEPKPVQIRAASAALSSMAALFAQLFGPKRDNPIANLHETSLTQSAETKSQGSDTAPTAGRVQVKAIVVNRQASDVQPIQEASAVPLADRGGVRRNLLIGAVPVLPAARFEKRSGG
jgi:murein L,D-transpeptidase YafK